MEWAGADVTVSEVEQRLARLRMEAEAGGTAQRTSVATHIAWVPEPWLPAALDVLRGLAERHPSRTIVLVPEPDASPAAQVRSDEREVETGDGRAREAPATERAGHRLATPNLPRHLSTLPGFFFHKQPVVLVGLLPVGRSAWRVEA